MQSGARAIADPDEGTWSSVEHERKILCAHHWRKSGVDFVRTGNLASDRCGKLRLLLVVYKHRVAAFVGKLGLGAIGGGSALHNHRQTFLEKIANLGDIGDRVTAGESFGEIESVKAVSDLYAPVSGEVTAVNKELGVDPSVVSADPFGKGWMLKVKVAAGAGDNLKGPAQYSAQIASQGH